MALYLWPQLNGYGEWIFFLFLITVGIPHGALDHLIEFRSTKASPKKLRLFYAKYLCMILLTGLIWLVFPSFALLATILISAYHFGQSQLFYLPLTKTLQFVVYTTWGLTVLSFIIVFNFEQCLEIFASLHWIELGFWWSYDFWWTLLISSAATTGLVLAWANWVRKMPNRDLVFETVLLGILGFIAIQADAIMAIAIYFGLWHSFRSLVLEYLSLPSLKGVKHFIFELLPFTLLALTGMLLINYLANWYFEEISPFMVFIVLVSALTVPHLVVMDNLYRSAKTLNS